MNNSKSVSLYCLYDVLAQDIMNVFPCPSDNAAILGFANAKKDFEDKHYNPSLLQLYRLCTFDFSTLSKGIHGSVSNSGCFVLLCDLLNAPLELERITNELLEDEDSHSLSVN